MIRFTKFDEGFDSIRFVLRARGTKDKTKPSFMGLYSDGENVVCCDSHRLQLAPVKMQDGLFEVVKNTGAEIILGDMIDGQFPDYKQVIPKLEDIEPVKLHPWTQIHGQGVSKAFFTLALAGVCVNYSYLDDAIRDAEEPLAYVTGEKSPVVITHSLGTAVIMPMALTRGEK